MLQRFETGLSSFLLFRKAGGDTRSLDCLQLNQTVCHLHSANQQELLMESVRESVEGSLYRLVPFLPDEDKNLVRDLLKLKRDVFNGRNPGIEREKLAVIMARLDNREAEQLEVWLRAVHERDTLINQAGGLFEQEISEASERLAEKMGEPEWQKGLVLASPEYIRSYRPNKIKQWLPKNQYARSSTSYLSRIVTKTSPFSTLTTVGLTSFQHDPEISQGVKEEGNRSVCRISQAVAAGIVFQLVKDDEFAPMFTYEKNPSIRLEDGMLSCIKSHYLVLNGFSWRQDQPIRQSLSLEDVQLLVPLQSGTYCEIVEQLSNRTDVFRRFLSEQWICPVFPYSRKNRDPLQAIAAAMKNSVSKRGRRIGRRIQFIAACEALMGSSSAEKRLRLQEHIQNGIGSIFHLLNQPAPDYLKKGNLVYEDVRADETIEPLGKHVEQDLLQLGEMMRPYLFRTHMYDLLVDHFVERYGERGTCHDLWDFFTSFDRRKDRPRLMKRALASDKQMIAAMDEGRVISSVSDSAAPPSATVFFQLASAKGMEGIRNGEYTLIANQLNPGSGGLFVRFLTLFDAEHGKLSQKMRQWLRTMYPEAQIVDFPTIADFSSLQIDYGVTDRALRWPGENPTMEPIPDLMLKKIRLVHTEENTLTLIGEDGRTIAPQYLGTIPHYLQQGTVAYFLTLISPWINGYSIGWSTNMLHPVMPPPEQIEFYPRKQQDRLVLRRARWRVPLYQFPLKESGENDFAYFRRLKRWQRECEIPDEVFISGERSGLSFEAKKRKPMWLSFNSYHAIEAAIQSIIQDDLLCLSLTEALPDRGEHWFVGSDGANYATEFLTLLQWPRTKPVVMSAAQSHMSKGE